MTLKTVGILILVLSTLVSWVMSMTANMEGAELGALYNLIVPPFAGVILVLFYLLICWSSSERFLRILVVVLSSLYLLYVGSTFRFNPGFLPIPF